MPCVGRCDKGTGGGGRPKSILTATDRVATRSPATNATEACRAIRFDAYRGAGGYRRLAALDDGSLSPGRWSPHSRLPACAAWAAQTFLHRAQMAQRCPPSPRRAPCEYRRGRAPAPSKDYHYLASDPHRFIEGHAHRRPGGRRGGDLDLHPRRIPRTARTAGRGLAKLRGALPALPMIELRRGAGACLRRGVGNDRIDRGQARRAATASAPRRRAAACSAGPP